MFPNNVVGVVHGEYLSIGTAGLALERRKWGDSRKKLSHRWNATRTAAKDHCPAPLAVPDGLLDWD